MATIILQSSSPKSEAWDAIHFETVLEVIAVEPLHITRLSSQFLFSTSNYQDTLSDERGGLIGSSRFQARTREYCDTVSVLRHHFLWSISMWCGDVSASRLVKREKP